MSVYPFSASNILLLLITAGLIAYFFFLWRTLGKKTRPAELAIFRKPVVWFCALYAGYFAFISLLAAKQFFSVITMPPRFLLIFAPLVVIVVLLLRAKLYRSLFFLRFLPPVLLIGVQVYRLLIELVFMMFANEKIIPVELSIHGRNYDLVIGVLALPVAFLFLKQHRMAIKAGIAFNVLGLLSLVNIFSIAIPSMPSPFRIYDMLYLPTYFPGITIVFLASAAIFLHILSLRQLLSAKDTVETKKENTNFIDTPLLTQ